MELTLTAEEQKRVEEFSRKIDLGDGSLILRYGAACQNRFSRFSGQVQKSMADDELDEACGSITELAEQLRKFSAEPEEKGFLGLFSSREQRFERWKERYDRALTQVDRLAGVLEGYRNRLLKDSVLLNRLYDTNLTYYKELSMYIQAGQQALQAPLAENAGDLRGRFEARLQDLALTRTVSLQLGAQLRLLGNTHATVLEKLDSTLKNTIPLWKNQMLLALGVNRSRQALEAQKTAETVSEDSMRRNGEALQEANEELIAALEDVLRARQKEME